MRNYLLWKLKFIKCCDTLVPTYISMWHSVGLLECHSQHKQYNRTHIKTVYMAISNYQMCAYIAEISTKKFTKNLEYLIEVIQTCIQRIINIYIYII